jgi:ABC-type Fe3+ transport system permease subunit
LFDRGAAAQLALCLLAVALVLATLERRKGGFSGTTPPGGGSRRWSLWR